MKKSMVLVACLLALSFGANAAEAISLSINDGYYVGSAVPGIPSDPAFEVAFINQLIGMVPDSEATVVIDPPPSGGASKSTDFYRSANTFWFVTPVLFADKDESVVDTYSAGTNIYNYVVGKYGNEAGAGGQVSHVWFSSTGFSGDIVIPATGLSHISVFNSFKKDVPDGGVTLMLLGGALVGLGALRRKFRA